MNPFHSPIDHSADEPGRRESVDFEARLRQVYLDHQPLDPATAGRLRAARRTALQAANRSPGHTLQRRWLPAGAFAVIALATLAIWQPADRHAVTPPQAAALPTTSTPEADADLPPDADSAEDAQLYQNLAFYDWLAAADHTPARR